MDGILLRSIFQHITYISITGNNPEKTLYTGPGHLSGYTGDFGRLTCCMPEVGLVAWRKDFGGWVENLMQRRMKGVCDD